MLTTNRSPTAVSIVYSITPPMYAALRTVPARPGSPARRELDRLGTDRDIDFAARARGAEALSVNGPIDSSPSAASSRDKRAAHAIGVAHESRDEHVARLLVELARRAFLRDRRLVHHDDAIGYRHRLRLVVRDIDDGQRQPLLQVADLLAHLPPQPRVEIRQRLVEQQHRGLEHQRARDGDALLLAAGQLGRQSRVEACEADGRQRGLRPRSALRPSARPATADAVADVLDARSCAETMRSSGTPSRRRARRRERA